jgi:hypothetical protein
MGAFTSLLAGFGEGFGNHMADVNEHKRQEDVQNKRQISDALIDYVKNNPNISPNDQERAVRTALKQRGAKDQDVNAAFDQLKTLGLHPAQQQAPTPAGVAGPVPDQSSPAPSPQGGIPPVPAAPPTLGGVPYTPLHPDYYTDPRSVTPAQRQEEIANRTAFNSAQYRVGEESAKTKAKSDADIATDKAKTEQHYKIYQQMEEENDKARTSGAGYRRLPPSMSASGMPLPGRVDRGILNPGYTNTEDIIGEKDNNGQQITDPSAVYRTRQFADGDKEHIRVEGQSRGAPVPDPGSLTGYSYPILNAAKKQIGSTPAPNTTRYGSVSSGNSTTDENGNVHSDHSTVPIAPRATPDSGQGVGGAIPTQPRTPDSGTPTPASSARFNAPATADDIINHRISPSQVQAQAGFGKMKAARTDHITAEIRKTDPSFNWEDAEASYQLTKSPAFQQTIRYIDNTIESLPRLQAAADKLNNGTFKSLNALKNMGAQQLNGVDIRVFDTDRQLVGDEIAKILQGGGTGSGTSDKKLEQGQNIIKTSDDPKLVAATLKEVSSLIGIRRNSLTRGTPYEKGGVGGTGIPAPSNAAGYKKIGSRAEYNALPSGTKYEDPNGARGTKP